jgi:hypothetical protein
LLFFINFEVIKKLNNPNNEKLIKKYFQLFIFKTI